jgi:hypothetical protein
VQRRVDCGRAVPHRRNGVHPCAAHRCSRRAQPGSSWSTRGRYRGPSNRQGSR